MGFEIIVRVNFQVYKMEVRQLPAPEGKERYLVYAKKGEKQIILQTVPLLMRRRELPLGESHWNVEGDRDEPVDQKSVNAIGRAISEHMEMGMRKSRRKW